MKSDKSAALDKICDALDLVIQKHWLEINSYMLTYSEDDFFDDSDLSRQTPAIKDKNNEALTRLYAKLCDKNNVPVSPRPSVEVFRMLAYAEKKRIEIEMAVAFLKHPTRCCELN